MGKNHANIDKLVRIFKNGYASEFIENAKAELSRCLLQEKNTIPEIIICESSFDRASIHGLSQFLNNDATLSSIPFILDATHLAETDLQYYKQNKLVDDIIFLEESEDEAVIAKNRFLRKIKSVAIGLRAEQKNAFQQWMPELSSHAILKRVFDIAISSIALVLLTPIFLMIALAIRLESKGSVFYISKRAGKGYRIFDF